MCNEKDLVKIKQCNCGYTVFCDLSESTKECICGKVLNMKDDIALIMDFKSYEGLYYTKNTIIEKDKAIMNEICLLWDSFLSIEQTNPTDLKEFKEGINILKKVMDKRLSSRL